MSLTSFWRTMVALVALGAAAHLHGQGRVMQPEDLFRIERIGAIAWTPDVSQAAVEIHRPGRWLGQAIPTADLAVVDAASGALRIIPPPVIPLIPPVSPALIGLFAPAWSPDGLRLLFLSVDSSAIVRPWLWSAAAGPTLLDGFELADDVADPPFARWIDARHIVLRLRDTARPVAGPLSFGILRGSNVTALMQRARDGRDAAVTVMDSRGGGPLTGAALGGATTSSVTLASVDVESRAVTILASGALHQPVLSADRRTLTYLLENPPFTSAPVASFFGPEAKGDAAYDRVNFGSDVRRVDLRPDVGAAAPAPDRVPPAPAGRPTLRVTNTAMDGTRLLLTRPGESEIEVWRGNDWVRMIRPGRAESIAYRSASGQSQIGWLLYPPDYVAGQRLPVVTIVYPGTVYSVQEPPAFSLVNPHFEHAQLFAARGYGVLLPSMPDSDSLQTNALDALTAGVLPLIDLLAARGTIDANRVGLLGQSAGGWAVLGLISRSDRFRTAIASASYSDLVSLYGTFYGQYRYGDAGIAERAQVQRMLQFERGVFAAGAPPWEAPDRYRVNSAIHDVARVRTPLMLVHGEQDFVPVQQAEEFFTALYRQDKRVQLVRYAGEAHTITARANVLDLWQRIDAWLRETMPARP